MVIRYRTWWGLAGGGFLLGSIAAGVSNHVINLPAEPLEGLARDALLTGFFTGVSLMFWLFTLGVLTVIFYSVYKE